MKVFLAGCEDVQFIHLAKVAETPNILFSYFHWMGTSDAGKAIQRDVCNEANMEVLCDSGLFTLMFGVGKGGSYDLTFMKDYTKKYITTALQMGIKNLTIVESDVHKLLGMEAVFELRKYFEDCGLQVVYVWHKEEGLDGLMKLASEKKYIALSVPELRILFKGAGQRYQTVVHGLLQQINRHCGDRLPKIHLLGNTVQETMETTLAYSCDSTSWLAGGRYGTVVDFRNSRLQQIRKSSDRFEAWKREVYPVYAEKVADMIKTYGHNARYLDYQIANLFSAMTMKRYQEHLDKFYPWCGARRIK